MALLKDFLANLNYPPATLLKQYLEDGIPEDLQSLTSCAPTDWCFKSSLQSSRLRNSGNEAYRLKKYDEALKYYSSSIAAAPTDSEALALAYGNRSALLQAQKEYELCLLDTNRALDGSLPQSSRMTLLERKAICWDKLQEQNVMRTKLRAGLSTIKLSSQERGNLMACERKLCYISKMDIDDTDLVIDRSLLDDPVFDTKFEDAICENLSPKVQRRVDEEWGQVFFATDDIEPGEVLSNDDFYALVLNEKNQHEFCSHCNVKCRALIPCPSCSQDMYCCVGCRDKAYDMYHETECKILPLWGDLSAGARETRRLFLRIFLTGTKQGSELTTLLNDPRVYEALNGNLDFANARFSSKDYLPILNSVWKLEPSIHEFSKQLGKMASILAIFVGLRYVNFFGTEVMETECSGNILTDEELLTTVLLVHNLSLANSRKYTTTSYSWISEEGPSILSQEEIGCAFGPWHTFLNHSCDPNVRRVASGPRVLCHSVRPIKAGEQIFLSNGFLYTVSSQPERQALFKQLWGKECKCKACVENWPTMNILAQTKNRYIARNKDMIKKIEKMDKWISKKGRVSIAEEDLKKVVEFSKTVRDYVKEPSCTILMCDLFFGHAMKVRGNLYFSQKYIESLYDYL